MKALTPFWLSWWHPAETGDFELASPWWVSGSPFSYDPKDELALIAENCICAAVRAESEDDAKAKVLAAYDTPPPALEWRFCEPRPKDWSPFTDRFERADWMKWEEA